MAQISDSNVLKGKTKGEVLISLKDSGYPVPALQLISYTQWLQDRDAVFAEVRSRFSGNSLAVRSSCRREDGMDSSMAGAFESLLNVSNDEASFVDAVDQVFESYGKPVLDDQVIVQGMVRHVTMSGVVMTHHLDDGAPYYVVNYDDDSGTTDSVTGGTRVSKTVFIYRHFRHSDFDSQRLLGLLRLVRRLEDYLNSEYLDIEFCIDAENLVHLLQVRPISTRSHWVAELPRKLAEIVPGVEEYLRYLQTSRPGVLGSRTVLGVMPDWNPAEIIGITPRPLAASLYRNVVTKRIWSVARTDMGYRQLPPEELMVQLAGRPYIDVRNSFNSLLPADLSDSLATRIVDLALERLMAHPEFHDKVEFEVMPTVFDFCFIEDFTQRYGEHFDSHEIDTIAQSYQHLTINNVGTQDHQSLKTAIKESQGIQSFSTVIEESSHPLTYLAQAKNLLEVIRVYGTYPFAKIARHAFMAEAILRSCVRQGALTADRLEMFRRSIETVSEEMSRDLGMLQKGRMSLAAFLDCYGHLRPGTYDILSPRYADNPEAFLSGVGMDGAESKVVFELTAQERDALNELIRKNGLNQVDADSLLHYASEAIAARESSKFRFTRYLSQTLECLIRWGQHLGMSREMLSWLDVEEVLNVLHNPILTGIEEHFQRLAKINQALYESGRGLKLGYLLRSEKDVFVAPLHRSAPNFITNTLAEGPVVYLTPESNPAEVGAGFVVCIESADPGYDWVFSRDIAGLVTQFGGTNSHMAIRCSEYGIPAAIGCGELLFQKVIGASRCEIDGEKKQLRVKTS